MQGVFRTIENREKAVNCLKKFNVEAIFNGSFSPEVTEEISLEEYFSD
jgi:hypothetical protein